jgi:hypothetical protein
VRIEDVTHEISTIKGVTSPCDEIETSNSDGTLNDALACADAEQEDAEAADRGCA